MDVADQVYRAGGKRLADISIVVLATPAILPVLLTCAVLIMLDGHSPLYSQVRVGRGGRFFRMWKLRSMVPDADALLERHLDASPDARREWDLRQKLARDPRITRIGAVLRRLSLDELPQLWNVLIGDMSLVGPRPMLPVQQVLYPGQAYYRLRPGLTGPWQVTDRNASSFAARAAFDDRYEQQMNPSTDLKILWSTVRVVLHPTGS